jgi:hypothetical protein
MERELAAAAVPEVGAEGTWAGIPLRLPPLVTLLPSFASTLSQTKVRRDARAGVSGTVTRDRDRRDSRGCRGACTLSCRFAPCLVRVCIEYKRARIRMEFEVSQAPP